MVGSQQILLKFNESLEKGKNEMISKIIPKLLVLYLDSLIQMN